MKALISGSSGFIGTHLIKELLSQKWEVVKLTQDLLYSPNQLKLFIESEKPDVIFHLAAYGNMSHQKDIAMIVMANIIGTFNLLNASKDISYKAFINVGSSSEYGKKDTPMTEDMLPEVDTFYGASKVSATYLCRAFAKQFTKPIVTIRPFSIYGEGEAEFRFIPQIITHLKTGDIMDVDLEGNHDWIYIEDLVQAVLRVVDHATELLGQVINIGTGVQTNNMQVVKLLEKISGKTLNINYFNNTRPNDSRVWVNGSKTMQLLGWKPQVSLEEGLRRCYEE